MSNTHSFWHESVFNLESIRWQIGPGVEIELKVCLGKELNEHNVMSYIRCESELWDWERMATHQQPTAKPNGLTVNEQWLHMEELNYKSHTAALMENLMVTNGPLM